jgi:GTP-binding protein EngB required for normal cell division
MTINAIPVSAMPALEIVPQRLAALGELTRLGTARSDGFDKELLDDAEALLRRSGERMRMSASHTVAALAGGTGSGKSSLFNALSGATFSPPGVTRPTTRHSHACVWGMEGAAPLLDWLTVQRRHRYARASALDQGEADLAGLLLLDLPDHDSVVSGSVALVDRLVKLADMLIWVLDPLKYADASVHQRYLVPLAGHAAVTTVVLNQSDTLTPEQVSDCEEDLRRLLDAEGLSETQILVTSATTGVGLDELRGVLAEAVAARRAASDRIAADIDALLERFAGYAGAPLDGVLPRDRTSIEAGREDGETGSPRPPWENWDAEEEEPAQNGASDAIPPKPPWEEEEVTDWNQWGQPAREASPSSRPPWEDASPNGTLATGPDPVSLVPPGPAAALTTAFERAAGMSAVAEGLHRARERTAARYVGWPPARLAARLRGRATVRRPQEGGDPPQAQRSDIDNAITTFADALQAQAGQAQAGQVGPGQVGPRQVGAGQVGPGQARESTGSLPEPWSRTVRAAARSRAAEAQVALGAAVARGLPSRDKVTGWWRLIALAQGLLMLLAIAGVAWIGVILAFGEFHASHKATSSLISDVSLIPWLVVMVFALLLLGSLTSSWCQNMVVLAADRERDQAIRAIRSRIDVVTREIVLVPVGTELADYDHFRNQLAVARGQDTP